MIKKFLEITIPSIFVIFFSVFVYKAYSLDGSISKINYEATDLGNIYYANKGTKEYSIPILVYHKINKESVLDSFRTREFTVPKEVFEEQMKYILDAGYTPVTMHNLIVSEKNDTLPPKPIVVTFDDGWIGQYTDALPILLKYNIPATFYVYNHVFGKKEFMTLDNVRELQKDGMEIGGHTVHHPHLTLLPGELVYSEIYGNKVFLETELGISLYSFAYPYGDFDLSVEKYVKDSGYESARTSIKTIYNDFGNLYELKSIYAVPTLEGLKEVLKN